VKKAFAGPYACSYSAGFLHNRFKEPIRIAPQYRCDLLSHLLPGHTNPVDDAAQIRLIDPHQLGQPILAHAGRIHSQLEIGVDTSRPFCAIAPGDTAWKTASNRCDGCHGRVKIATAILAVTKEYVK